MLAPFFAAVLFAMSGDPNVTALATDHVETSVAAFGNRVVVAAIRITTSAEPAWIDVFVSDDGGRTFGPAVRMPQTIAGVAYGYEADPSVVVFDDGSFGIVYLALKQFPDLHLSEDPEVLVFVRSTNGRDWSEPQVLLSGRTIFPITADRPFLAVDATHATAYLLYTSALSGSDKLMVASTTDRGAHWSDAIAVTSADHLGLGQIAVAGNGTVIVAGFDTDHLTLVRLLSTDGGKSWGDELVIGTKLAGSSRTPVTKTISPAMSNMAAWRNNVYDVYPATDGVYFTHSSDDGATWSPPLHLGGATGDALLPTVTVDEGNGDVFVSWLDGRDDTVGAGTLRLYGARFTSAGTMTEGPRAFTSAFDGGGSLGDVNGIASVGRSAAVTAFGTKQKDLFAVRLEFTPPAWHRAAHH